MVQTDLTFMRKNGTVPYEWLANSPGGNENPTPSKRRKSPRKDGAALPERALGRRRRLRRDLARKGCTSGVVYPITETFDVPFMVARGYASSSFLHEAAEYIASLDVPAYIYHLGDFDPSGQDAARAIERRCARWHPRRKSISNVSPSRRLRSESGVCRPGRPRRQISGEGLRRRHRRARRDSSEPTADPRSTGDRTSPSAGAIRSPQGRREERTPTDRWTGRHGQVEVCRTRRETRTKSRRRRKTLATPEEHSSRQIIWNGQSRLKSYFEGCCDWLTEEDKADWVLYTKILRAEGNTE